MRLTGERAQGVETSSGRRTRIARDLYTAFAAADREVAERILGPDFSFFSPVDVGLDRAGYFERCSLNAGLVERFDFVRLTELGDEVLVTYESTKSDGNRFRNTEVLTFLGDKVVKAEVYFGWDLPPREPTAQAPDAAKS